MNRKMKLMKSSGCASALNPLHPPATHVPCHRPVHLPQPAQVLCSACALCISCNALHILSILCPCIQFPCPLSPSTTLAGAVSCSACALCISCNAINTVYYTLHILYTVQFQCPLSPSNTLTSPAFCAVHVHCTYHAMHYLLPILLSTPLVSSAFVNCTQVCKALWYHAVRYM